MDHSNAEFGDPAPHEAKACVCSVRRSTSSFTRSFELGDGERKTGRAATEAGVRLLRLGQMEEGRGRGENKGASEEERTSAERDSGHGGGAWLQQGPGEQQQVVVEERWLDLGAAGGGRRGGGRGGRGAADVDVELMCVGAYGEGAYFDGEMCACKEGYANVQGRCVETASCSRKKGGWWRTRGKGCGVGGEHLEKDKVRTLAETGVKVLVFSSLVLFRR
jgi:hypothetical protein